MTLQFNLTVSDNLQIFGFFLLKSVSRAKNTAPRIKIIHFTPSVHNTRKLLLTDGYKFGYQKPLSENCVESLCNKPKVFLSKIMTDFVTRYLLLHRRAITIFENISFLITLLHRLGS
jgi:hypothetical protein